MVRKRKKRLRSWPSNNILQMGKINPSRRCVVPILNEDHVLEFKEIKCLSEETCSEKCNSGAYIMCIVN